MRRLVFLLLALALLAGACNPVKRVLQDETKYARVKAEVIRRGDCKADTLTRTTFRDQIVYRDTTYQADRPGLQLAGGRLCDIDTVFQGFALLIREGEILRVAYTGQTKSRTRTVLKNHYIRDVSRESQLVDELARSDTERQALREANTGLRTDLDAAKADLRYSGFRFWGLLLVFLLLLLGRLLPSLGSFRL
jgi:hypothetical protein